MIDEIIISKAIIESYLRDLTENLELDVIIAGAGPSGPLFEGMLLSSKKVADIIIKKLS